MRRRLSTFFGVACAAASLVLTTGALAQAATLDDAKTILTRTDYVALGDSYAAGTGDGSYGTSGSCYRSAYGYPVVASTASGATADVTFLACSGAKTANIAGQVAAFGGDATKVTYVTLTIGGNDAGFADVITRCLKSDDCSADSAFTATVASNTSAVTGKVAANITAIRSAFPNATILVTGYPQLFQNPSSKSTCSVGSLVTVRRSEANYLDTEALALNSAIRSALPSGDARVKYVDVVSPFTGHGLCLGSTKSWINALNILSTTGAFHPNKNGQNLGYATAVATQVS